MEKTSFSIVRFMPFIFGFGILFNTVLSLTPTTAVPDLFIFWDKAQHSMAFTALAMTGCLAYPQKEKTVSIGLVLYGAAIEIMQSTLTTTRYGDVFDWMADGIGVVAGFAACAVFVNIVKSLKATSDNAK